MFVGRSFPYLHTDEVADLLNEAAGKNVWNSQAVRRWLLKAHAVERSGERWVTTADLLRDAVPAMWRVLMPRLIGD